MCEANAYLVVHGEERLLMESVDTVRPEGEDVWRLENIFGDRYTVRGRIREMALVNHRIVFEETAEGHAHEHVHRHAHEHVHDGVAHAHEHEHMHSHPHGHEGSGDEAQSHEHEHPGHDKEPHGHEH
ncbi:MAG: CooT family nickel-binding protein [Desulfatibacillaceae bacterium]